ncbi:small subunit ribosomal protein S7e [Pancytospora philotis]|nr:small subunit ribosomal protein S7e [Pancytospora philotis]
MNSRTEAEVKVSKVIKDALADSVSAHPQLQDMADRVTVVPLKFGNNMSEVVVVKMDSELLRHAKLVYSKMVAGIAKIFANAMVLTMNNKEIAPRKNYNPKHDREAVVNDLVFPSVVAARATEVESRDDMRQLVYLDSKNQVWSNSDLATIEKVLAKVLQENYAIGFFNAGQ